MKTKLKMAFRHELTLAQSCFARKNYDDCFHHLERAHVLGQRNYIPHVMTHFWMLKVGLRRNDAREVLGQIIRILGSVGSVFGWVPVGNTGGSNVSAIQPMSIPDDLAGYFQE